MSNNLQITTIVDWEWLHYTHKHKDTRLYATHITGEVKRINFFFLKRLKMLLYDLTFEILVRLIAFQNPIRTLQI